MLTTSKKKNRTDFVFPPPPQFFCRVHYGLAGLIAAGALSGGCSQPRRGAFEASTPPSFVMPENRQGQPAADFSASALPDLSALSVNDAILLSLERQPAFMVERLRPELSRAAEERERAVFDPGLSATLAGGRREFGQLPPGVNGAVQADGDADEWRAAMALEKLFATGARVDASIAADSSDRGVGPAGATAAGRYGLSLSQPLLEGFGRTVRTARLRQAALDVKISHNLLQASAEVLAAGVEKTAWRLIMAERRMAIVEESLRLAESQRDEVMERIRIGRLPEIDSAAGEAEVAQRREDLINTRSAVERARLEMLRLLGCRLTDDWNMDLRINNDPRVPDEPLPSVEESVASALVLRPDLQEARLQVEQGELELVRTRNGLLPRLDAFVALGYTGYGDSFGGGFSGDLGDESSVELGLRIERAIGSRRDRAVHRAAMVGLAQAEAGLENMEAMVQAEVRAAHVEARRSFEQIEATRATRRLREAVLQAETEQMRVGKSTSLMVARAQRDLLEARLSEEESVISHLIARQELYRAEGSLLARKGIKLE